MLKRLRAKNFRSHKDTVIEFHPYMNVFIGSSDHGKSDIARMMRWFTENRPVSDKMRSHWGGDTHIILDVTDNKSIAEVHRLKTDTINEYAYVCSHGSEKFRALGQGGAPDEISEILNLLPVNIQYQFDTPFLLSATPGARAQYLNEVSKLGVIDTATANVNSKLRNITAAIASVQEEIDATKITLNNIDHIAEMENDMIKLEQLEAESTKLKSDADWIRYLIDDIKDIDAHIDQYSDISRANTMLDRVTLKLRVVNDTQDKLNKLDEILDTICWLDTNIEKKQEELNKLEQWWHDNCPDMCPMCEGKGTLK